MSDNIEIFEGKTFQDLTKDIYDNKINKKKQIDLLISEIHGFITTIDDVVLVAPIIKEYMEIAVKNDEALIKMAAIVQKDQGRTTDNGDLILTELEKQQLIDQVEKVGERNE